LDARMWIDVRTRQRAGALEIYVGETALNIHLESL
jgi:hypothetical protein